MNNDNRMGRTVHMDKENDLSYLGNIETKPINLGAYNITSVDSVMNPVGAPLRYRESRSDAYEY